jgi:hypothetical protein
MHIVNIIGDALTNSFELVFRDILIFIPKVLLAFVILTVLVWIAKIVSKLIGDLLRLARIDSLLARVGVTQAFHEVGFQVSIAYGVQTFVKWILILVAFVSSFSILGLDEVVYFLEMGIFQILPNIITLAVMLFLTIVAANKTRDFVNHSSYTAKHHSPFLGNIVWFAVILFGTIATFQQLDILRFITDAASGIIQALGLGIALALGLAFGLGCKEEARCVVRTWMGKDCYDLDCGCNTFGCAKCAIDGDDDHNHDCDCDDCSVK